MDSLNITFDLVKDNYKPYRQSNNKPLHINKHSNQPLNILKQLPKSFENLIYETSLNIDVMNKSVKIYKDALFESNLKQTLQFLIPEPKNNDDKKKR